MTESEGVAEQFTPPPNKLRRAFSPTGKMLVGVAAIMLGWALLQVLFVVRAQVLTGGPGSNGLLDVYRGLLSSDWSFSWRNSPPLQLLEAIFFALLNVLLGWGTLKALDVHLRPRAAICLSYAIGMAVSGIVFELVTMAHLLYLPVVWIVWVGMLCGVMYAVRRRDQSSPWRWWETPSPESKNWQTCFETGEEFDHADSELIGPDSDELFKESQIARAFFWFGVFAITVMTAATFWHGLFFPETYWDSLILYLGYGRMTFLEHAFPTKVVAQVGIGLGANYPHLFANYGAVASTMFGTWSDLHQRLAGPLAGLASTLIVYETLLAIWGRRSVAMAGAVLLRATPLFIAYSTYASDYAIAILFVTAFIYFAFVVARTQSPGSVAALTLIPAAAMHINYLMGILWVPWVLAIVLAFWPRGTTSEPVPDGDGESATLSEDELSAAQSEKRQFVWKTRQFWLIFSVGIALSLPWYVRNIVVTGNPVYSFFPNIFVSSKNINPDVLESANLEWFRNGDGVGRLAEQYADMRAVRPMRDQNAEGFEREATLRDRLAASYLYWQGFETFRPEQSGDGDMDLNRGAWLDRLRYLLEWSPPDWSGVQERPSPLGGTMRVKSYFHAYKIAPLFLGFFIPGLILAAILTVCRRGAMYEDMQPIDERVFQTVVGTAGLLAACLFAYHYILADLYLYQIIPVIIPMAIFGAVPFLAWTATSNSLWRQLTEILGVLTVIAIVLIVGIPMSLMNFKTFGVQHVYGQQYVMSDLDVFRHPGMNPDTFYRLRFGTDADMWNAVNEVAVGQPLLTHDNRHLMYDPSIELVHLDDWDVQKTYAMKSAAEKLAFFRARGIRYYLRIPNEAAHPINARVGLDELIANGSLVLEKKFGENELYRFVYEGNEEVE